MERYDMHEEIGNGSFGSVFRATRKRDGKVVAIKKLFEKYDNWSTVRGLREFRALVDLPKGCQSLCMVHDIMREGDGTVYYAMELMPGGCLKEYIESFWPPLSKESGNIDRTGMVTKHIDPSSIQSILRQVFQALQHIHSKGYMHRDLKPENILMSGNVCKLTDFSLTRTVMDGVHNSRPQKMTSYVSTRWYRAPEIILCAPKYSSAVDIFALGCIMAEMYRLVALLPGSSEIPQLAMICELWGGPPHWYQDWPAGKRLAQKMGLEVEISKDERNPVGHESSLEESIGRSNLRKEVPSACEKGLTLMENCLKMNPNDRPKAAEALQYDFFQPLPMQQNATSSSRPIGSITPSPVPSDTQRNFELARQHRDASFLDGSSPAHASTDFFTNQVGNYSWDECNAVSGADPALCAARQSSNHHSPAVGFPLSPFNVGNDSWKSMGSDKASLLQSLDSKKRLYLDSSVTTNSHRKKRGNGYKPSFAFSSKRKF